MIAFTQVGQQESDLRDKLLRAFRARTAAAGILKSLRVHLDHEANHVSPAGETKDFNQTQKETTFFFKEGKTAGGQNDVQITGRNREPGWGTSRRS